MVGEGRERWGQSGKMGGRAEDSRRVMRKLGVVWGGEKVKGRQCGRTGSLR